MHINMFQLERTDLWKKIYVSVWFSLFSFLSSLSRILFSISFSLFVFISLSFSFFVPSPPLTLSLYLYIYLSACLSTCASIYLYIYLSRYTVLPLIICHSNYLAVCLPFTLSLPFSYFHSSCSLHSLSFSLSHLLLFTFSDILRVVAKSRLCQSELHPCTDRDVRAILHLPSASFSSPFSAFYRGATLQERRLCYANSIVRNSKLYGIFSPRWLTRGRSLPPDEKKQQTGSLVLFRFIWSLFSRAVESSLR